MKTIKSLKDVTTLKVGDKVVFGDLEYEVTQCQCLKRYYLDLGTHNNDKIFKILNIDKIDFIKKLGIEANYLCFPETRSLEALTAVVSALFKEYEKQKELPKTWEEFCEKYSLKEEEAFINSTSEILTVGESFGRKFRVCEEDKNLCVSEQEAGAFLALMQLRQLRKVYVKDWVPNWVNDSSPKFCIECECGRLTTSIWYYKSHNLSFPSRELAEQFLINFKELLETAKPLL